MPSAKTKSAPVTNGAAENGKSASPDVPTGEKNATSEPLATLAGGKPDKKAYDTEQERLKVEIDAIQLKLSAVREKISLATKSGSGNDKRAALRAELEGIRGRQSNNKTSRSKILDQIKFLQDGIQKKVKDIQAAKSKISFKTVDEVDAHIKNLEKQVESGSMKLADEKRALQEISSSKRNRRTVESFQADQDSIEADRRTIDELRKQLDDPEFKTVSDRYEAIKAELDELKKEGDEAYADRSKLFEERDNSQSQLNTLYNEKRESSQQFKDGNDRYWNKLNEDRARRAEKARIQRAAEEAQKKQEIAQRIREEAEVPAFQAQIEDCQTLIDYFSGKSSGNVNYSSTPLSSKPELSGVPKLEIRKVEAAPEGSIVRKKKGELEDAYFVGGKGKKGKRGAPKSNGQPDANVTSPTSPANPNASVNVPLATLSALLALSIPPPSSSIDVPRVIEDLKTKKIWFEANQGRVTAENISKAETDIQRLTNGVNKIDWTATEVVPPNGKGQQSAEPASTPQVPVPSSEIVEPVQGQPASLVAEES